CQSCQSRRDQSHYFDSKCILPEDISLECQLVFVWPDGWKLLSTGECCFRERYKFFCSFLVQVPRPFHRVKAISINVANISHHYRIALRSYGASLFIKHNDLSFLVAEEPVQQSVPLCRSINRHSVAGICNI